LGVRLEKRGPVDPHICIKLLSEDDENWFDVGNGFSSFWLNDLITQLQAAEVLLEQLAKPDRDGFGFEFEEQQE